ncbi:MAG: PIN domain-containing protein [Desulfobacteraceae bacterium]|nr:MAG: PIN domain-containing protein [Desulfobacteraceae bacterium]
MKFWDSSAIIPLCLTEAASAPLIDLAKADEHIIVWWGSRVECISALSRRLREGALPPGAEAKARTVLYAMAAEWSEVQATEPVRLRAERLLMVHPLRTADALQLAAALIWAAESPKGLELVSLDQRLRDAATKEGFTVLPVST